MEFSSRNRKQLFQRMQQGVHDVLVIGGGITGAGIALDAQSRGMSVALVEMQDFAAGTSGRSTKLVHGGLRYLKQYEVKMVADVGKERAIVYENGPHVTTPEWMLLPFHKGGTFGRFTTSIGLRLYDFLAGVKKSERRMMLSAAETIAKEPLLKRDRLLGGGYYVEYRTDDARLTIEVIKKAVELGALALNYAEVTEFIYVEHTVVGVVVRDVIDGERYTIKARKIVNATGPWVDALRHLDRSKRGKQLHLTKGAHIVFDQSKFPLKQAVYFDAPDRRMIFAIPRDGKTYVGTTDTNYDLDPTHPHVTQEDRQYLLTAIRSMFPDVELDTADIESSWAGIRPLIHEEGKKPSEISRRDEVFRSPSGLISIAGGKLTGYRKMAESIVDTVAKELGAAGLGPYTKSKTKHLPISGGDVGGSAGWSTYAKQKIAEGESYGLTYGSARKLVHRFGSNIDHVYAMIDTLRGEAIERHLPLAHLLAIHYGIEQEMVVSPVDIFIRRSGGMYFDIECVQRYKERTLEYMGQILQWSEAQMATYERQVEEEIARATQAQP